MRTLALLTCLVATAAVALAQEKAPAPTLRDLLNKATSSQAISLRHKLN